MDLTGRHASAKEARIKQEEDDVKEQIKRESLKAAGPLKLIPAKKRKRTDPEIGNDLFLGSAPEAVRKRGTARTPGVYQLQRVVNNRPKKETSDLYENLDTNPRQTFSRADEMTLKNIQDLIQNCIGAVNSGGNKDEKFNKLRTKVHEMEFYPFLNGAVIKKSRVLESKGLERIFAGPEKDQFLWDIRADAEALWFRWKLGNIDAHLLRGIQTTKRVLRKGLKRTAHKLETSYEKKSANVAGANNLINGQWWPSRLAALRDGAHGEQEAGIHGQVGKGAFSVVMSAGYDEDRDEREAVEYCGTRSETMKPTKGTNLLLEASKFHQPLRLLRSASEKGKYAPKEGIRYDGLYEIVDYEILNPKTAFMRFSLRRLPGQDPIRYKGVEARPTDQELAERMKIRDLLAHQVA